MFNKASEYRKKSGRKKVEASDMRRALRYFGIQNLEYSLNTKSFYRS